MNQLFTKFKKYSIWMFLLTLLGCQNAVDKATTEKKTAPTPPNILFLIADDWSYPHAGIYGDKVIETPTFDKIAKEGALFHNAYCASPSCAPSRAAILTSRYPHQLGSAGNLWSVLSNNYPNWMEILEREQYFTGLQQKGWAPGDWKAGGYEQNPAGKKYDNFEAFMKARPKGQPFAFWFGSTDPHRPYMANTGVKSGKDIAQVEVPEFLPDVACVRNDILDYYYEIERFDKACGKMLQYLEETDELEHTLIIMTSDNGMPFPRAKANLYDYGTRMPLAMAWKAQIKAGTVIKDFMNFVDFGPTILEAVGINIPKSFHGESLLPILKSKPHTQDRHQVYLERERHANVRKGDLSYPCRAIRTDQYLYIQNFEPERWPAGDPTVHMSVGQYGDIDNSISKFMILANKDKKKPVDYFNLSFEKRPAEELYDVQKDPFQLHNLAADAAFRQIKINLKGKLHSWMAEKGDRRSRQPNTIYWDTVQYATSRYRKKPNFDLKKELEKYKMLKAEEGTFVEVPCTLD